MNYNLKYLKYKNKYINLKNMIGNGKQTEINQELEILKKKSKDYYDIDIDIDIVRATTLMKILNDIENKELLSNLIFNIFYYKITDKEITNLIKNLFTKDDNFGITDKQKRYKIILDLLIFKLPDNKPTEVDITYGKQLKNLSNFTKIQFDLFKKILNNKIYHNKKLFIELIIEIINDKKDINKDIFINKQELEKTVNDFIQKGIKQLEENVKQSKEKRIEGLKQSTDSFINTLTEAINEKHGENKSTM